MQIMDKLRSILPSKSQDAGLIEDTTVPAAKKKEKSKNFFKDHFAHSAHKGDAHKASETNPAATAGLQAPAGTVAPAHKADEGAAAGK